MTTPDELRLRIIREVGKIQQELANVLEDVAFDDNITLDRWSARVAAMTTATCALPTLLESLRTQLKEREEAVNAR